MVVFVLEDIKNVIAYRFEISFFADFIGFQFLFIIWLFERLKIAEHVHNRFFGFPFADSLDTLLYSPYLCTLSELHVILQLDSDMPSWHQKLTNDIGRDYVMESSDDVCS